jgi:hypothetical protein
VTALSSGFPPPDGYDVGSAGTIIDLLTCSRCGAMVDRLTGLDRHDRWHAGQVPTYTLDEVADRLREKGITTP